MSSTDVAKDKAARLLKKRGSIASSTSNEYALRQHRKQGWVEAEIFLVMPATPNSFPLNNVKLILFLENDIFKPHAFVALIPSKRLLNMNEKLFNEWISLSFNILLLTSVLLVYEDLNQQVCVIKTTSEQSKETVK